MNGHSPALSIVVPLYNSAETLPALLRELSALQFEGGHELVLVNDGSRDATEQIALQLMRECAVPVKFISHSRNFGEHNAVLAGLRETRGDFVVTMDDDLQNPPSEVAKLLAVAQSDRRDVVYSAFDAEGALGLAQSRQPPHEPDCRLERGQAARTLSFQLPLHLTFCG